jgi:hypothetical protein
MDIQNQIELEKLYAKNHLMDRLRSEFRHPEVIAHAQAHGIPVDFAIDLLSHMTLRKRARLSVLVGILHRHFGEDTQDLQTCVDMLVKACHANFVDFDGLSEEFVFRFDVSEDVHQDLERFQYPLPMVVPPLPIRNNRTTGYATIRGSVLLNGAHHEDDVCLDHLDRANSVALTINPDTARMIQNQWRNLDKPKEGEDDEEYLARVKAFEKYDRVTREVLEAIYMTGQPFWLTHRYDSRGRVYAQGYHVNPQGNAWNKAVIEFADGEIVT